MLDVFPGRFAGFALDEVAEIVGRQAQLAGTVFHRRQPLVQGVVRREVGVEQLLETGQNIAVGLLPGDELPLVETQAIVQQQFDLGDQQPPAHAVDIVIELLADGRQTVDEGRALAFGEVQRLVDLVGEEGVLAEMEPEEGAADQVGVEAERMAPVMEFLARVLDADDLSVGESDDCTHLLIATLAAVVPAAILLVLEEYNV